METRERSRPRDDRRLLDPRSGTTPIGRWRVCTRSNWCARGWAASARSVKITTIKTSPIGPFSVLVVDDDQNVREAITALVGANRTLRFVASAADGLSGACAAKVHQPDVAVVDVRMPIGGAAAIERIRAASPHTAIVVYSALGDPATEQEMRGAGAVAFILKGDRNVDLVETIERAAREDGRQRSGIRSDGPSTVGQLIGAVFSASSDAVVIVDETGAIVLASPAITALFGYYPDELVGEAVDLLVPEEFRDMHSTHRKSFLAGGNARRMGSGLQLFGQTRDGERLPIDVSLNPIKVAGRHYVAAFVRDATERLRSIRQMEAVNAITSHLLSGASMDGALRLIMTNARELVDGAAAWCVIPKSNDALAIEATDGPGSERLLGIELSASTSRSALVLASGEIDEVDDLTTASNVSDAVRDLELGSAVYVPLAHAGHSIGVLVIARNRGDTSFDRFDLNLVSLFANAASGALALGNNREQIERLRLAEEDERIGRDLHDTVIQRAFTIAMSLQAVRSFSSGRVLERIDAAVDGLDAMIRELRNSIFRLAQRDAGNHGLRSAVLALIEESSEALGFTPRFASHGPVDTYVTGELRGELLAVCREAISNIARHAHAQSADLVIRAEPDAIILSVMDNGVGMNDDPTAGHGVTNMGERARRLGGSLEIERRKPSGTILTWWVPQQRLT